MLIEFKYKNVIITRDWNVVFSSSTSSVETVFCGSSSVMLPMFSYFVNVIQKFEKNSLENFHTNAHKTFKILNRLYVNLDCLSQWRVYHKETFKILLKTIIDIDKNVFWTWQSIIQILYFAGNSLALVSFKQEVQGLTIIFKSSRSVGLLQHFFFTSPNLTFSVPQFLTI